MSNLDETDMDILRMLAENARRPYSDIGDEVGLSGPAVSDRVSRLRESGVLRRFTVDVDRSQLRSGVPVLVEVDAPSDAVTDVRETFAGADAVEHVFVTAAGEVVAFARLPEGRFRTWVAQRVDGADYDVRLVDDVEWTPHVDGGFALACAECGNTVTDEGESTRIGGELYHFCCPSCEARFEERYERLEEEA